MHAEPAPSPSHGRRAWHVSTTPPLFFTADDGNEYALPPSFKDTTALSGVVGAAYVVYAIKAVAKRHPASLRSQAKGQQQTGSWLRNAVALSDGQIEPVDPQTYATWFPFLVASLADRSLSAASLVMPPPVAAPGDMPALPVEWQSLTATQVNRKALFRDRGEIEAQMYSPPLLSVSPGTPIPFFLRLIVRAKAAADAAAIVPSLPLDGRRRWTRIHGQASCAQSAEEEQDGQN